jgi:hypothetical protein
MLPARTISVPFPLRAFEISGSFGLRSSGGELRNGLEILESLTAPASKKLGSLAVVVAAVPRWCAIGEPGGELSNSMMSAPVLGLVAPGGDRVACKRGEASFLEPTSRFTLLDAGEPDGLGVSRRLLVARSSAKRSREGWLPPLRSPVVSKSSEEIHHSSFRGWADGQWFEDSGIRSTAAYNAALSG